METHPASQATPALDDFMNPDASFLQEIRGLGREEAEDFVAFEIYVTKQGDSDGEQDDRDKLARYALSRILEVTEEYREAYFWHHETFMLSPVPSFREVDSAMTPAPGRAPEAGFPLLRGCVHVGDNIEDEWFTVWLLRRATGDPALAALGLAARVWDADGDFLLIEAALAAPGWLDPDNSAFRVWIKGGEFHFISIDHHPLSSARPLAAADALRLLSAPSPLPPSETPVSLAHPPTPSSWLNTALNGRMAAYPAGIGSAKHRSACYLPVGAAVLLQRHRALLTAAVRTLRSREPGELLRLMRSERNNGGGGRKGGGKGGGGTLGGRCQGEIRFDVSRLVPVQLTMTRLLFGQLESDSLQPPKAFMSAIVDVGGRERERAVASGKGREEGGERERRVEAAILRGVRLACGLEILYWRLQRDRKEGRGGEEGKAWTAYQARLRRQGFWGLEKEGSAEYRARTKQAWNTFTRWRRKQGLEGWRDEGLERDAWMRELLEEEDGGWEAGAFSPVLDDLPMDDDEGWMQTEPKDLERLLEHYAETLEGQEQSFLDEEDEEDEEEDEEEGEEGEGPGVESLTTILEGMKDFVTGPAGLDGAEVRKRRGSGGRHDARGSEGGGVRLGVSRLLSILEGGDTEGGLRTAAGVTELEGAEEEEEGDNDLLGDRGMAFMHEARKNEENDSDDGSEGNIFDEETVMDGETSQDREMEMYLAQMDKELVGTTLADTFERAPAERRPEASNGLEGAQELNNAEDLPPVDVDLNLVRHLLESVAAQGALPGPASNLLRELWET